MRIRMGWWLMTMALATQSPGQESLRVATQPGIPGRWDLAGPAALPPLEEVLARPGPGRLIYGLYTWGGEYRTHRAAIRAVGWPSIRIAGPFDDDLMQMLVEDEARVMVTLENRLLEPAAGKDRSAYPDDAAFLADARAKMMAFLDRYGPGGTFFAKRAGLPARPITEVEIWNEPNFQYLIPPDGRPLAEVEGERERLYVKLLEEVTPALRARHPGVTVVGMAGGGMSAGDLRFVDHTHAQRSGLPDLYDVLSTHPYVRPAPPEANSIQPWGSYSIARSLDHLRGVLARAGAPRKPVWITEIGWPVSESEGGRYATPPHEAFASPLLQAAYICRTYALALRLGVERVHVMFAVDTDHFNGGFFLPDGTWRPSAHAARVMIRLLPDPQLTGALSDGQDGYFAYTFQSPGQPPVVMAWNVTGPREAQIPVTGEQVRVTDMLGHAKKRTAVNGMLTLTVGPCPVYVTP
jgi:hypothetical protein